MELTPRQIVHELDRYIIGQEEAKKSVAIALRNRYRRSRVPEELRDEISPKNILMIGPTGVGKTEIARRLARLVNAPFIKVEATKFTEVGYVGRDVESIIRDLTENAIRMVRKEHEERVLPRARVLAEDALAELLVHPPRKTGGAMSNPLDYLLGRQKEQTPSGEEATALARKKEDVRQQLMRGELEENELEIEVAEEMPTLEVGGSSISLGDMMGNMMPQKTRLRHVKVREARKILTEQEDVISVSEESRDPQRKQLAVPADLDKYDELREERHRARHHHSDQKKGHKRLLPAASEKGERVCDDRVGDNDANYVDGRQSHRVPDVAPAVVIGKKPLIVGEVERVDPPVDRPGKHSCRLFKGGDDHPQKRKNHRQADSYNKGIADKEKQVFFSHSSSPPSFS